MTECIKLTESTLPWFEPMMDRKIRVELASDTRQFAVGAVCDKTACGFMICRISLQAIHIIYLLVADEFRRRGAATSMVEFVCENTRIFPLPVVIDFAVSNGDNELTAFASSLENFTCEKQPGGYGYITMEQLKNNRLLNDMEEKYRDSISKISSLYDLSVSERLNVFYKLQEIGFENIFDEGETLLEQLCFTDFVKNELLAAVFCRRENRKNVCLNIAYSRDIGGKSFLFMLLKARQLVIRTMPETERIYFIPTTKNVVKFMEHLVGEVTMLETDYHYEWNMSG